MNHSPTIVPSSRTRRLLRFSPFAAMAIAAIAACGSDDNPPAIDAATTDAVELDTAPPIDAAAIDGPAVTFSLTSTVITEGGVIPDAYSCSGANISPPLAWTGAPTAPGFALIFDDITNLPNPPFLHSLIWDIPGTATSLPENIQKVFMPPTPAGSKQPIGYNGSTRGYLGPCPGSMHRYRFTLYAVDVYPLPSLTMQSDRFAVRDAILAHDTASATLTATFTP